MPRPDKPINSGGRLDDPASSSRAVKWTKHGGIESSEGFRGTPSTVEITVDDITVVDPPPTVEVSKWEQRGTSAHIPAEAPAAPRPDPVTEWVVVRTIEDRTYRRTDELTVVEDSAGA